MRQHLQMHESAFLNLENFISEEEQSCRSPAATGSRAEKKAGCDIQKEK